MNGHAMARKTPADDIEIDIWNNWKLVGKTNWIPLILTFKNLSWILIICWHQYHYEIYITKTFKGALLLHHLLETKWSAPVLRKVNSGRRFAKWIDCRFSKGSDAAQTLSKKVTIESAMPRGPGPFIFFFLSNTCTGFSMKVARVT